MIVHRCDICRSESSESASLTRVQARINLYALSKDPGGNHVLMELDVCAKEDCRRRAIRQLAEAIGLMALEKAGLSSPILVAKAVDR